MEISKIIRLLVGSAGFLITACLLYLVWRFYAYFYMDIEPSDPVEEKPLEVPKETYKAPRYVYNTLTHEFHVTSD